MTNTIGTIPPFTSDDGEQPGVKKDEEEIVEEAPTSEEPTTEEVSTDDETTETTETSTDDEGADEGGDELAALRREREALLGDIKTLRGERRELRSKPAEEPLIVPQETDDLSDVAEEDLTTLRRVLKAEGYVKASDLEGRFTKEAQDEVRDEFLDNHPEYKPENDKDDLNWKALTAELGLYAQPKDKKTLRMLLNRAHEQVSGTSTSRVSNADINSKKRVIARAGAGAARGGGRETATVEGGKIPAHLREHMKGFDDEDFE